MKKGFSIIMAFVTVMTMLFSGATFADDTNENTENKTVTAGSGNVKNIKKNTKKASVKSAREKINDAKEENNKKDIVSNNENKKTNKAEKDKNKKQGKTVKKMLLFRQNMLE